ncbi:uncharacterized protein PAC_16095 [Phialocephala subalpina]|uniref:Uncharacterized protein n=1 Tax=Phialocephala subalpina TaxID=576137 RepID=A0A1L7XMF4_9HELO|nr:uncharacterized protein PAC_16095 [Phialocephala subalpina]
MELVAVDLVEKVPVDSPLSDPTTLQLLQSRVLQLRALQGIPEYQGQPKPDVSQISREEVELIFQCIRYRRDSRCFGPSMPDIRLGITPGSVVLFKLLSVTLYLQPERPDLTRILCCWVDRYLNPLYSCYGTHELRIRGVGSSLQIRRSSRITLWLTLFFRTYESPSLDHSVLGNTVWLAALLEMIFFYCSFTAAKFRSPLTASVEPDEPFVNGESVLFRGKIVDDGFEHFLTVLQDKSCGAIRLLATVRNGELTRCPIWTAFAPFFLSRSGIFGTSANTCDSYSRKRFPGLDQPQESAQNLAHRPASICLLPKLQNKESDEVDWTVRDLLY